tara:strand:- start:165 stop:365 length:201 start_codon:yes stop_codon:yes gene_type:complete
MTLTKTVEESLRDAQEDLRNALAFAARSEKSYVAKHIANILANIDNIIDSTKIIEMLEDDIKNHND